GWIAAAGVAWGTRAAVENTAIVTVTVKDAVGSPTASVTFAWNVTAAPPVASKLTAKDVCGPNAGRHWKVSNVAGGRNRAFEYFTLLSSGRWHLDGSASVRPGGSVTIITHRGTTLRLRWGNGLGRVVTAAFRGTMARACEPCGRGGGRGQDRPRPPAPLVPATCSARRSRAGPGGLLLVGAAAVGTFR